MTIEVGPAAASWYRLILRGRSGNEVSINIKPFSQLDLGRYACALRQHAPQAVADTSVVQLAQDNTGPIAQTSARKMLSSLGYAFVATTLAAVISTLAALGVDQHRAGRDTAPIGSKGRHSVLARAHNRRNQFPLARASAFRSTKNRSPASVTKAGLLGGLVATSVKNPGGVLLSHTASRAVPSAPKSLTSEFGMGSGVASSISPPETVDRVASIACGLA